MRVIYRALPENIPIIREALTGMRAKYEAYLENFIEELPVDPSVDQSFQRFEYSLEL